jgi:nitroimidazol reductase NimA-like FMN-containing flavoprotein (pyridoxamine 5'-phosphate oxidase superfamily)
VNETTQEWRGKVGRMSAEETEAFLARGRIMRLACLDPDGWPYVVPCWHEWREGAFWVVPRQRSLWAEHLKRDPRAAFVVDDPDSLEKVWGRGRAELVEEPNVGGRWVEVATRMAERYLGPNGPDYLVPTLRQPRWLFRIEPVEFRTWQGVGWARRYWVEGTGGPSYEEAHGLA